MSNIKFGTDGWRAIIAKDFTIENVKRVSEATARWMLQKNMKRVVIGYDCRFGGKMFSETAAGVFANFGIHVLLGKEFVSTPMVSLALVKSKSEMGVVITASHNPPSYNGYKLKSGYGGPTIPSDIVEVEALIPDTSLGEMEEVPALLESGKLEYIDMEQIYIDHIKANFDLDMISKSKVNFAYDAMWGAGQNVIKRLFPKSKMLHCEYNPSFMDQAPEPILRNLGALAEVLKKSDEYGFGLANDGDADRIGMFDADGNFVDSHHLLLLLLHYQVKYKKLTGKVVITFSVTDKMKMLAEHYGLEVEVTKIGFKYIAEIMVNEDVVVGGEESGGLAVKGHIPERDGIWNGLLIMEFMALTGKSMKELIQEIYDIVGPFSFDRDDLHVTQAIKTSIIDKCKNGDVKTIGNRAVVKTETIDGYKFYLSDTDWVMIRPSGTEPVLRVYAQATTAQDVRTILDQTHETLNS